MAGAAAVGVCERTACLEDDGETRSGCHCCCFCCCFCFCCCWWCCFLSCGGGDGPVEGDGASITAFGFIFFPFWPYPYRPTTTPRGHSTARQQLLLPRLSAKVGNAEGGVHRRIFAPAFRGSGRVAMARAKARRRRTVATKKREKKRTKERKNRKKKTAREFTKSHKQIRRSKEGEAVFLD